MPLREPTPQAYFKPLKDFVPEMPFTNTKTPTMKIPRYTKMKTAEFFDAIRTGQPFVVDDCAEGWSYKNWQCKDFGDHWPKGNMKAEYSKNQGRTHLGDGIWWNRIRDGDKQAQHISKGAQTAGPYIWHVKDEEPIET